MAITLTESAAKHVANSLARRGKGVGLRLGVRTSGCSGLAYKIEYADDVRPEEVAVLFWCWLYIFAVLSSYYIMRPIRDEMGVAGGVNNLPWLFTGLKLGLPYGFVGAVAAEMMASLTDGVSYSRAGSDEPATTTIV